MVPDVVEGTIGVVVFNPNGNPVSQLLLWQTDQPEIKPQLYSNRRFEAGIIKATGSLTIEEGLAHENEVIRNTAKYVRLKQLVASQKPFAFKVLSTKAFNTDALKDDILTVRSFKARYIEVTVLNRKLSVEAIPISIAQIDWPTIHLLDDAEAACSEDRVTRNRVANPMQNDLDEVARINAQRLIHIRQNFNAALTSLGQLQTVHGAGKLRFKDDKNGVFKAIQPVMEQYRIPKLQHDLDELMKQWEKFNWAIANAIKSYDSPNKPQYDAS